MQKIVNVIALASGVISLAVVVGGVSLYVNRDSIIDNIKSQALEAVTGSFGGSLGVDGIPTGTNDLVPPADVSSVPPSSGGGLASPSTAVPF